MKLPTTNAKSRTTLSSTPKSTMQQIKVEKQPTSTHHKQLLTWEIMFGNLQQELKTQQKANPGQKTLKFKIPLDPIDVETPLNQPNRFQFNNRLRLCFREYLNGDKSAVELVNEMNSSKPIQHKLFKSRIKRVQRMNMFAAQMQSNNKFRMLHLQGFDDQIIDQKIRIQQRYDKLRKLIQGKIHDHEEPNEDAKNFRSVELFKNMYQTCEDNKMRISQKNLLSERTDGKREYVNVQYMSPKGTLRIRSEDYMKNVKETNVNTIKLQNRMQYMKQKILIKSEIETKLDIMAQQQEREQLTLMDKARREMLLKSPGQSGHTFHYYNSEEYKLKQPLNKDVKLYAYLFGKNYKTKVNEEKMPDRLCQTTTRQPKIEQKHYLGNFGQPNTSRDNTNSNDSSLNSMNEMHIDNLYRSSNHLQQKLKANNSEKFVKRIKQFQKVLSLNEKIIQVNQNKLSNYRKLI